MVAPFPGAAKIYSSSPAPSCNIFNIVSILVFIAAIWRVRSAMLLPPAVDAAGIAELKFVEFEKRGAASTENFFLPVIAVRGMSKQSLQYTGFSPSGRNGTWHFLPQLLHTASNFWNASLPLRALR
jgi:hypothetical protein